MLAAKLEQSTPCDSPTHNDVRWGGRDIANSALAAVGLFAVLPMLCLVALALLLFDRGPIFFGHERIGRNGRKFKCYKFRSMRVDADQRLAELLASNPFAQIEWEREHKLRNDPRITGLGMILRRSSIDELPQLWNVLRGDMRFVGPRPIVTAELMKYGRYSAEYLSVKPGLTGLWQVSGRNNTNYRQRVALDVLYVRRNNWLLDLHVLISTVPAVLFARGSC